MSDTQVPAGWYPDPTGDTSKIRYWNGSAWTDEFMDAAVSAGQATSGGDTLLSSSTVPFAQDTATPSTSDYPSSGQPFGYQQAPYTAPGKDRQGMAIASLILGIVSILACLCSYFAAVPSILAIIFGIFGLKSSKKGLAIAGLILGGIGIILAVIMTFVALDIINDPSKYGLPADFYENLYGVFVMLR